VRADQPAVVSLADVELSMTAVLSADVHPDSVSMPHGWFEANVCDLTSERDVDSLTGMVVQTAIPVELRRPSS
jgi:hypothetical protein